MIRLPPRLPQAMGRCVLIIDIFWDIEYSRNFRIFLQKKNEGLSSSLTTLDEIHQKKIAVREALRARWRCDIHTTGDRPVPCWRDGFTDQCFAMTENDLNMWADLHVHRSNVLCHRFANITMIRSKIQPRSQLKRSLRTSTSITLFDVLGVRKTGNRRQAHQARHK